MKDTYLECLKVEEAIEIANAAIASAEAGMKRSIERGNRPPPANEIFNRSEEDAHLLKLMGRLSVQGMSELTALAILGRKPSDETLADWDNLVRDARSIQTSSNNDISHLSSRRSLGENLMDGLKEIGVTAN